MNKNFILEKHDRGSGRMSWDIIKAIEKGEVCDYKSFNKWFFYEWLKETKPTINGVLRL